MAMDFQAMLREAKQQAREAAASAPVAASAARLLGVSKGPKSPSAAALSPPPDAVTTLAQYCARPFEFEPWDGLPHPLSTYRLPAAPSALWYIPDIVSAGDEARMLAEADAAPSERWTHLSARRLQNWGGLPSASGLGSPEALPPWLEAMGASTAWAPMVILHRVLVRRPLPLFFLRVIPMVRS